MKRYHEEQHIVARRERQYVSAHEHSPRTPGRFRKTHIGCNRASCQLCHPEKFPRRIPTRKEQQALRDLNPEE
jgi:hypothetical protein